MALRRERDRPVIRRQRDLSAICVFGEVVESLRRAPGFEARGVEVADDQVARCRPQAERAARQGDGAVRREAGAREGKGRTQPARNRCRVRRSQEIQCARGGDRVVHSTGCRQQRRGDLQRSLDREAAASRYQQAAGGLEIHAGKLVESDLPRPEPDRAGVKNQFAARCRAAAGPGAARAVVEQDVRCGEGDRGSAVVEAPDFPRMECQRPGGVEASAAVEID